MFGARAPKRGRVCLPGCSIESDWIAVENAMVQHANYHGPFHVLLRANRTVVLALLWTALAACIAGSLVVDIAHWLDAWRDLLIVMLAPAAAV
jgi:hypothetical protein